jgi:hypothetical protein
VLQVDESFDGDQLFPQGGVGGWGGRQQQQLNRRVFGDVEVVFTVVARNRVGLNLDIAVGSVRAVIDPR